MYLSNMYAFVHSNFGDQGPQSRGGYYAPNFHMKCMNFVKIIN